MKEARLLPAAECGALRRMDLMEIRLPLKLCAPHPIILPLTSNVTFHIKVTSPHYNADTQDPPSTHKLHFTTSWTPIAS